MKLRQLGTSAAALALLLAAGCGSGGGSATADGSNLTKSNFASKVVTAQQQAETAHLEAKIGPSGQEMNMSGDVDVSENDVALDFALTGGAVPGDARFILVDKVIYLQVPGLSQGDKFVKVDTTQAEGPSAAMFQQMLSQFDPSKTFAAFKAISTLKEQGTEEIDGVETTKYAIEVDSEKALEAMGTSGQVPQGSLPKTLKYDVWVDGDDLVRRLNMSVQNTTVSMNFSQWGEPVDISAPPKAQTTEMPQMGGMSGSKSSEAPTG